MAQIRLYVRRWNRIVAGILLRRNERRYVSGGIVRTAQSLKQTPGQHNAENRSGVRRAFLGYFAAMILTDFLHDRQSQTSAIFLAEAHEGLEQTVADGL